jgi:hypothetical protein
MMSEETIDLEERFPDLRLINSPPSLGSINGVGTAVYGGRDHDEETGTYITTQVITILFIPVLALGAYRVADAEEGGWYFIGKEPLSALAKFWNALIVVGIACIVASVMWNSHTSSPEYRAKQNLNHADQLAEQGELAAAADLYREVANSDTKHASDGVDGMKTLINDRLDEASPKDGRRILQQAVQINGKLKKHGIDDLYVRGEKIADKHATENPTIALAIFDLVAPLAEQDQETNTRQEALLQKIISADPSNVECISRLAQIYEKSERPEECEKLLEPHKQNLGDTEGARILGQIFTSKGQFDDAYALLEPYTQSRLKKLHAAEQVYERASQKAYDRVIDELNNNKGPKSFYKAYDKANQQQKDLLLQEYTFKQTQNDSEIKKASEAIVKAAEVVPVALDLGIVLLRRAQAASDPDSRQANLEKAEKTFLATQSVAGQSDEYRLFLGQVYYWLGKHDEGKTLFDELLSSNQRKPEILLSVGRILREIGIHSEARKLAEEAHATAPASSMAPARNGAAMLRALLATDLDERVVWLRKCDQSEVRVRADLNSAIGQQAARDGNDQAAIKSYRKAIQDYSTLPDDSTKFNNTSLIYLSLFRVTGDQADFDQAAKLLDQAVALSPDDSILLGNAADSLLEGALADVFRKHVELSLLKIPADANLLSFLYDDQQQKNRFITQINEHAGVKKALQYVDKVMLLAPKSASSYQHAITIHSFCRNIDALDRIAAQLRSVDVDLADAKQQTLDFYSGSEDEKIAAQAKISITSLENAVADLPKNRKDRTLAVGSCKLVTRSIFAAPFGIRANAGKLVTSAEKAYALSPSSASRRTLIKAHLYQASQRLAASDQRYAAAIERTRRSLGGQYSITVAMETDPQWRQTLLADKNVKRAAELVLESQQKFPNSADAWDWSLLRYTHPDAAEQLAEQLKTDRYLAVSQEISDHISLLSASDAYEIAWLKRLQGKDGEAEAVLKSAKDAGVPMFKP